MTETVKDRSFGPLLLTIFLFLSTLISGLMSRGFGLSLTCMINATGIKEGDTDSRSDQYGISCDQTSANVSDDISQELLTSYHGSYEWSSEMQASLISSYSWGGLVALPIASIFVTSQNCKLMLTLSFTLTGAGMAVFPPFTIYAGYNSAWIIRFLTGAFVVLIGTATDQIVGTEVSSSWKTVIYTLISAGSHFSAVISNAIGGYLCSADIFGGWPAIFYLAAMGTVPWLVSWEIFKLYVRKRSKELPISNQKLTDTNSGYQKLPWTRTAIYQRLPEFWRQVGRRPELWALLPCVWAASWTTNLLNNYIPSFYRDILQISLRKNGIYSALPFLAIAICSFGFSFLSDVIKKSKTWTKGTSKYKLLNQNFLSKIFNTFGFLSSGTIIALTTLIPCLQPDIAIALLIFGAGMYTAVFPGYRVNIVTLSPQWTSIVSVLASLSGMVANIVFPYFESVIVRHGYFSEWRVLFLSIVTVDVIAVLLYLFFGSVTLRPSTDETAQRNSRESELLDPKSEDC